jgi:pilus assembly protein CpaB
VKQKNMILMVVAVGCGLVAAFLTTQINAKPKVEMVEVVVAAKDLPVGTMLTRADLAKLVNKKKIPKDALPPQFVSDEAELFDKRLTRAVLKDEVFNPGSLTKGGVVTLPEGYDMVSLQMSAANAAGGFVGPGSKVDVLAGLRMQDKLETFPLLVDMLVLAVNQHVDYNATKSGSFPDINMVSLAVTQEQALLLTLAKQRGCQLELLLRHPGKPKDPNYNMEMIMNLLKSDRGTTKLVATAGKNDVEGKRDNEDPIKPVDKAPQPEPARPTTVKVMVATEDIAPNTAITLDLIKEKFKERDFPKEFAEGAVSDLTQHCGQALKNGLAKGMWVAQSMVGPPQPKPAPQDSNIDGKPGPNVTVTPKGPTPTPAARPRIHDVAVHTASGTIINRYEQQADGTWKLIKVLTVEEAAAAKAPAASDKPATEKAPGSPDVKKVD